MKTSRYINLARGLKCSALSLTAAAIALVAALPGTARAGSIIPPANTTTIIATNVTVVQGETVSIAAWNKPSVILNQTGGVITVTASYGDGERVFRIGSSDGPTWGEYNMSGNAGFSALNLNGASYVYSFTIFGHLGKSKLTMTDNATANFGSLTLKPVSGGAARVVLSGSASLTLGKIGNVSDGYGFGTGCYIDFASGSLATLTITGKLLADYTAYVAAGNIRINGATADISKFQLSGSTLSLAPVVENPMIVATQSSNGMITPSGTNWVVSGSTNTYSIIPDEGYHVATLTVDDIPVTPPSTNYTFVSVTANHTITATFAAGTTVTITATQSPNGSITPSGVTTLSYFDSQVYSIIPDAGYYVYMLTVDGTKVVPVTNYTFSSVVANHTITASFSNSYNTLNMRVPGTRANIGPDVNGLYTTLSPTGLFSNNVAVQQEFVIGGASWNSNYGGAGTLNQTGGTITKSGNSRANIGWACLGTYNMSGSAGFVSPDISVGQNEGDGLPGTGIWSLTDTARATVGTLIVGQANTGIGRVSLAGSAQLTVTSSISLNTATASYISFASKSAATLTIAGKVLSNYQDYVTAGKIRIDGVTADISQFVVTGNTLSLKLPPRGTLIQFF